MNDGANAEEDTPSLPPRPSSEHDSANAASNADGQEPPDAPNVAALRAMFPDFDKMVL